MLYCGFLQICTITQVGIHHKTLSQSNLCHASSAREFSFEIRLDNPRAAGYNYSRLNDATGTPCRPSAAQCATCAAERDQGPRQTESDLVRVDNLPTLAHDMFPKANEAA